MWKRGLSRRLAFMSQLESRRKYLYIELKHCILCIVNAISLLSSALQIATHNNHDKRSILYLSVKLPGPGYIIFLNDRKVRRSGGVIYLKKPNILKVLASAEKLFMEYILLEWIFF